MAVTATAIPYDSADAPATATVQHYTTDPSAGTALGNINLKRVASPAAIPATWAGVVQDAMVEMLPVDPNDGTPRPVTLRGVAQGLVVNFAGAALVAGQTHIYEITWTEE